MKLTFSIFRFNPEKDAKPYYQTFVLDLDKKARVLDALHEIKWKHDGTLTFRRSCAHGMCGSDAMTINGQNYLACQVLIRDLKTDRITVEPLRHYPVVKDLVVNMDSFWENLKRVKPYLVNYDPPPATERLQSAEDQKLIDEASKCILCGACTSSCPSFWADPHFLGPATLLKAYRFIFDTRDQAADERLRIINDSHGVWRCHTIFNCVEACPRKINITDALSKLKRRLVSGRL